MDFTTTLDTPLGRITLVSNGTALVALRFGGARDAARGPGRSLPDERAAPLPEARRQLEEYFAGIRTAFGLPLAPRGTVFQRRVWRALLRIPHGATAAYGEIARAVGSPRAARAVGAACRCNPLAILVPCHRVVGADGGLTGYAGGPALKQALLDLEARAGSAAGAITGRRRRTAVRAARGSRGPGRSRG